MLRVLHVITGLGRGGAEAVLSRLVAATQDDFEHVVVTLRDEGHYGPILRSSGVRVHALGVGYGLRAVSGLLTLKRVIRSERPDVVQTWMYHADLLGGAAARLAGVRAVLWGIRNTNLSSAALRRSTRAVAWLGARLSRVIPDAIVCNSRESARAHAAFGYRSDLFRIVPNGYDLTRFQPDAAARSAIRAQFGIRAQDVLIGMVARWDPQKDHSNLLGALGIVVRQAPAVRLMLVGDGMDPANTVLGALLSLNGLNGKVILAGARNDVPAIMNALDLHVLSSLGEAFPNVLAEAMACGTPCVTTDVGDAAHIVGTTGWVARPRDSHALSSSILEGLTALHAQGREALGAHARARIAENFDLSRMTTAFSALWREFARQAN
jgi:glycosyltransferase involved in cell wall biosynthesis